MGLFKWPSALVLYDRTLSNPGQDGCVYLVVTAGGVEGVGAAGEQRLVVSGNQHFDVVVALVLKHKHTTTENRVTTLIHHDKTLSLQG